MLSPLVDASAAARLIVHRAASVTVLGLITLALAQGLDLATFNVMVHRHGVAAEANPFVSGLFMSHGIYAVVQMKVALIVLIGALTVASVARERVGVWRIVGGLPVALGIAAGVIGAITNTAVILH